MVNEMKNKKDRELEFLISGSFIQGMLVSLVFFCIFDNELFAGVLFFIACILNGYYVYKTEIGLKNKRGIIIESQ